MLKLAVVFAMPIIMGHTAIQGWDYPSTCCGGKDCREVVLPQKVTVGKMGFTVPSGEIIGYSDGRLRKSLDEFYHWCTLQGADDGSTLCLFVPPQGM